MRIYNFGVVRDEVGHVFIKREPILTYQSLEELRESMKNDVDRMIDRLQKSTKGHTCTRGTVIHPLIHIVHDDENMDNKKYIDLINSELN